MTLQTHRHCDQTHMTPRLYHTKATRDRLPLIHLCHQRRSCGPPCASSYRRPGKVNRVLHASHTQMDIDYRHKGGGRHVLHSRDNHPHIRDTDCEKTEEERRTERVKMESRKLGKVTTGCRQVGSPSVGGVKKCPHTESLYAEHSNRVS